MNEELISKFSDFEVLLAELRLQCQDPISESKNAISLITDLLDQVQALLAYQQFNSKNEELNYFKNEYPKIYEHLHYYKTLNAIEAKKDSFCLTTEQEIEILESARESLKLFQDQEILMLSYCNQASIEEEEKYFLRDYSKWRKLNFIAASNDSYAINSISEIIGKRNASRKMIQQIDERLHHLKNPNYSYTSNLKWTDSKVNLITLIYSIYISGSINNGDVELNQLIETFERFFNIDLKNFHSQLNDIKAKKGNQFKYIDTLRNGLEIRLNQ